MKALRVLALLVQLSTVDQDGLAEYGRYWWIVKPVVTGQPCPECAAMLKPPPAAPTNLTLQ